MALCLVVVAIAAEVGGTIAALTACAIETYGVYCWVLVPAHAEIWMQSAAFLMTALLITYLIHLRNCAVLPTHPTESQDRSVTDSAPDVIVVIDEGNHILSINPAVKAVFGYEPEESDRTTHGGLDAGETASIVLVQFGKAGWNWKEADSLYWHSGSRSALRWPGNPARNLVRGFYFGRAQALHRVHSRYLGSSRNIADVRLPENGAGTSQGV